MTGFERLLVVTADDLGASAGINRGILDCFDHGIVTGASLMVDMPAAAAAAASARSRPDLSVGLHVALTGRDWDSYRIPPDDAGAVRSELSRQLERFRELTGSLPTHIDSHHHVHRDPRLAPHFVALAEAAGVHLRDHGGARYFGGFYGQWADGSTHLDLVSADRLIELLSAETGPGLTEFGLHPGYPETSFDSSYALERAAEARALQDPRVADAIQRLGIRLVTFRDVRGPLPGS